MPGPEDQQSYISTLLELGRALNGSLDLSEVMHIAIDQVVEFVRAERGFIVLTEGETHRIWRRASHGIEPVALERTLAGTEDGSRPGISRTIVEQAIHDGRAVLSLDAMEDPRFAAHTSVRLSQVRSVLCVPLMAQGQILGVIYVDNRVRSGVFDERHAAMLTAFANQAAIAIENARLYENLRRSLEERLRLQQELHEKETQRLALEEAGRLKSDFISYLSHELRNPITTIRGYAQTLATDVRASEELRAEFLGTIESECDRMLDLINSLLDSSRIEAGRPLQLVTRSLDLAALMKTMAKSVRYYRYWKPGHTTEIDIDPDVPAVEADEDKVRQILANLLSNAVKYSPEGGPIRLACSRADGGVLVQVCDQGVGIATEQQARLFHRYERLERRDIDRIPGTGLGLYLTRRLVELHNGTIACRSEPGKGTCFVVFFPTCPASCRAEADRPAAVVVN